MSKALILFAILAISSFAFKIPSYSSVKDCAQASLLLVHSIQQFQADLKNGTYSTYYLSQEVVVIISQMQDFFAQCNIPTADVQIPSYSDPAMCLNDMYILAQESTQLLSDIKARQYNEIYTDSMKLYTLALQTQSDCQGQLQTEAPLLQQTEEKDHFWDIKLWFDYNKCIDQAQHYYNMLLDYQDVLQTGNEIKIVNATFKVWDYIYTLLPTCGLNKVEDLISEQAPQSCELNLYNAFNYGWNCYQLKTQPVKYAKCLPKATYLSTMAKQSCPFLNNQTDSKLSQQPLTSMDDIKEMIAEKFNFTQCWQQITVFGDDLTNWATAMQSNNTLNQINATTAMADEIYKLLPACGLQNLEEQISVNIPQTCVDNLGNAAYLGYQCYQVKSQPVKFAKCMPKATIAMNKAKTSCPFLNNSTSPN